MKDADDHPDAPQEFFAWDLLTEAPAHAKRYALYAYASEVAAYHMRRLFMNDPGLLMEHEGKKARAVCVSKGRPNGSAVVRVFWVTPTLELSVQGED